MLKIIPRRGEKIQQTLRRFKKMVEKDGLIKEMKRLSYYETPSEKRSRIKRKRKREQEKTLREARKRPTRRDW